MNTNDKPRAAIEACEAMCEKEPECTSISYRYEGDNLNCDRYKVVAGPNSNIWWYGGKKTDRLGFWWAIQYKASEGDCPTLPDWYQYRDKHSALDRHW